MSAHIADKIISIVTVETADRFAAVRYKQLAEELGITVAFDPTIGWSFTTVPAATTEAYRDQLTALHDAMTLWRTDETQIPATRRRNTNLIAAICPCGRSIRAAVSTLAEAPIVCTACGEPFMPKNADA